MRKLGSFLTVSILLVCIAVSLPAQDGGGGIAGDFESLTGGRLRTVGIVSLVVVLLSLLSALLMVLYTRALRKAMADRTAELEEKERDLSQAQRLAHIGNWILDSPFTTIRASDEGSRIFGFDRNELPVDEVIATCSSCWASTDGERHLAAATR